VTRLGMRLIVALLAEWLRHKLDPAWEYKRAQRRVYKRLLNSLFAVQASLEQLTLIISGTAERFRAFADSMKEADANS
jgi:hypothetical protein